MTNWETVKYFKPAEFGPRPEMVVPELVYTADAFRDLAGCPFFVHCSWAMGGHAKKSLHYRGLALDGYFAGPLSYMGQFVVLSSFRQIGGLGFYPDWENPGWHVDIRSENPRLLWVCQGGKYEYGYSAMIRALIETIHQ